MTSGTGPKLAASRAKPYAWDDRPKRESHVVEPKHPGQKCPLSIELLRAGKPEVVVRVRRYGQAVSYPASAPSEFALGFALFLGWASQEDTMRGHFVLEGAQEQLCGVLNSKPLLWEFI